MWKNSLLSYQFVQALMLSIFDLHIDNDAKNIR